jgi:hypothetical protein
VLFTNPILVERDARSKTKAIAIPFEARERSVILFFKDIFISKKFGFIFYRNFENQKYF